MIDLSSPRQTLSHQRALVVLSLVFLLAAIVTKAETPPPTVRAVLVNQGSLQRSSVTNITLLFDRDVSATLTATALLLRNLNTAQLIDSATFAFSYNTSSNAAIWTFPAQVGQSVPDGNYTATLRMTNVSEYNFNFFRYFGDANGDRDVDFSDLFKLRESYQLSRSNPNFNGAFDYNSDGMISPEDVAKFNEHYLSVLRTGTAGAAPVITSPANLSFFNSNSIVISGTVGSAITSVSVNSVPANLQDGTFTVTINLREGNNIITVVASDAAGNVSTASQQVTLDTSPPRVTIDSPREGAALSEPRVTVTGIINDTVVGTVNGDQARVEVNGVSAQVANRTYIATDVPLVPGTNTIVAVGTDRAGNSGTNSIKVFYNTAIAARIKVVSGNHQSGQIGTLLPQALLIRVIDIGGNPVPDKKVIFKVCQNDGLITSGSDSARSLIVMSGADGLAQVQFRLGTRAGAGNNQVEASVVGFEGTAMFCASATPSTPGLLTLDAGNNQSGVVGQQLPKPFVTIVVDSGNNRLHNVPITYTVTQGGGSFGGASTRSVNTDTDGRALAVLTLAPDPGIENNVVEVTYLGNTGLPVTFVASGKLPADPAETSITGVVLDNTDLPVPGATMHLVGTALSVRSDANGYFQIKPAPVGAVKLHVDGSTVTRPGTWVNLEFDLNTIPGQDNGIGMPVRLLPMDLAQGLFVDETRGGALTLRQAPGYSLTIAPGSVTFPGGGKSGLVSVTIVHPDKIPDVPNFGQQPRFIVSIQPAGAIYNPPAPMCIPNLDSLPPGQKTEMYSFDHDLGSFISIGTGTVSEDGMTVCSDPGVGIIKGGWHCGGNPAPPGSTEKATVKITTPGPIITTIGNTISITAQGDPAPPGSPPYTWISSDGTVAKITAGQDAATVTVRGEKAGKATLTVVYRCKSNQPSAPESVEVCVADGFVGPPVGMVNYTETITAPTSGDYGLTSVKAPAIEIDLGANLDIATKKWKFKITHASSSYDIFYRIFGDQTEGSAAAATETNYCQMIDNLTTLGLPYPPAKFYVTAAVEAHERQHVTEWKQSLNPEFQKLVVAVGGLTLDYICGESATDAVTRVKMEAAYTTALTDARNNAAITYNAIPDPNANTDAAEHGVVDPIVQSIRAKATMNMWAPCPP